MPISALSSTVQPCSEAWWPIVTPRPIEVLPSWSPKNVPAVRNTHPSCTLVRAPMEMLPASAVQGQRWRGEAVGARRRERRSPAPPACARHRRSPLTTLP